MSEVTRDKPEEAPLNPALKSTTETVFDTRNASPAPIETTSSREGEGEGWPIIWVVVTVICVIVAIYLMT